MKAKILALLRQREDYVSGQELCERFGVSRTAVWKAIGQLKKEGYRIEAVQNRGYRLASRQQVYGQHELVSRMDTTFCQPVKNSRASLISDSWRSNCVRTCRTVPSGSTSSV